MRMSLNRGILLGLALCVVAGSAHAQPSFRSATSGSTGASPAFRAAASAATASATLTIGKPSGTVATDVMIAAIGVRPHTAAITAPAGWTLVRRINNTNTYANSLAVYRKTAGASEPAAYDWTLSGADFAVGGIQSFLGVDSANPIDVESGQSTGVSLSHATPSVTTTVANTLLVTSHSFATATTWSPPAGMTEGFEVANTGVPTDGGQSIEGNWATQATAGATGAKTATASGGPSTQDRGNTHILALRPATNPILTLGKPSGTVANDVMIAAIGVRPHTAAITPPAGWTLVRRINNTNTYPNSLAVYRRSAGAFEPASYDFSLGGADFAVGGIQSFLGVDSTNPIDVENGQSTAVSLSHATPSVTTTVANTLLVTAHSFATATTWSPPAGMTEGFEVANTGVPTDGGQSIEGNWATQATAGATGAKTATASGGPSTQDRGNTHILALRPGSAQPSQLHFIHTDHLNTPRLITNGAGQAVWRWDQLDPFGGNVPNENPSGLGTFTLNLRFPGQYFDKETNLHYNYFRDYDPAIGRYIQSDPIGVLGLLGEHGLLTDEADPYTQLVIASVPELRNLRRNAYGYGTNAMHGVDISLYAYVNGNPVGLSDPMGLQTRSNLGGSGLTNAQQRLYTTCMERELKTCTIGTVAACGILCGAAATKGGAVAGALVLLVCLPIVDDQCVKAKGRYCLSLATK